MTPECQRHQRAQASLRRHLLWKRKRDAPRHQLAERHREIFNNGGKKLIPEHEHVKTAPQIPVVEFLAGRHESMGNARQRLSKNDVSVLVWTMRTRMTNSSSAHKSWKMRST